MLTIRLQRAGKKNKPEFRIVLAEKAAAASKKFVEVLGHYNPRTKDFGIKEERVKYWIEQHVELSPTINNLFVDKKLVEGKKAHAFAIPKKAAEPAAEAPAPAASAASDDAAPADAEPAPATAETPAEAPAEAPASEEAAK